MRLLLINPKFPESFWSFRWAVREILPGKRAINPPLGLATLAALCPPDWDIEIVDENIEPIPLEPRADIVGVCGMGVQFPRQRELLRYYRGRGHFVVAGGSYASLCPEKYGDTADAVIAGEAEHIWPQFCRDFEAGEPRALYRETGEIALATSPVPRFDLLKLERYSTATLQFSRGCPYLCEFCDIIVMFGRKPRCKGVEQVERELDALREAGVRQVFFVDDNLIGSRPAAKALLAFLAGYQARHGYRFSFGTEASLNLAQDPELLALFRDAGFSWIFIGIETTDTQALKDTRKMQNTREDVLTSVQRIYAHGIDVLAGFIVGFDNDTLETFERQHDFIRDSGIQAAMVGLLTALPRTPLYERVRREGRLIELADDTDNTRAGTNIVPKHMSYEAMIEAYQRLYRRLLTDTGIAERIRNKSRWMGTPVYRGGYPLMQGLGITARLFWKGILPGGPRRIACFLRTLPLRAPSKLPMVINDWICGLAMREYVERRFYTATPASPKLDQCVRALRAAIGRYLAQGRVTLALRQAAFPDIAVSLTGLLDRRFFARAAPRLERLLSDTRARLTLRIEALQPAQLDAIQRLLGRLAPYGDRVSIAVGTKLRGWVHVDSSVFNLLLSAPGE